MRRTRFFLMLVFVLWLGVNLTAAQNLVWETTNGPYGGTVRALAINKTNGYIFAAVPGNIFRSFNNGDSWNRATSVLTRTNVWSLAINAGGEVFAGTYHGGIFRSTNNGEGWLQINTGLTNLDVRALALNRPLRQLWAATNGGGVFRVQFTTGVKENVSEIPRAFMLAQNHPNPFNPSTTIKYDLAQAVEVQLAIFDLTGRCVRTLVNQKQQAGRYEVTWDGRNEQGEAIASGLYNYQLRAVPSTGSGQAFVQARRMALVR